jgi:uncharacterized protein (TIGR02147 family)
MTNNLSARAGHGFCPTSCPAVPPLVGSSPYTSIVKTNALFPHARPTPADSFRLYLQAELGRRCARSQGYSLRAFAKFLGIEHATLSQLLRGKRRLTGRAIGRLGARLGLSRSAIDTYVTHESLNEISINPTATLQKVHQLAHDTASLITDWHHYAILELVRLQAFRPNTGWIARVLGISPDEVNIAVTRLAHLGLLEMTARDRWVDRSGDTTANLAQFTQVAIQNLSEQVRRLLMAALKSAPPGRCEHSSTTLAINTARLPAVIEAIARFQLELVALLRKDEVRDDVYQLEISLFPLTTLQHHKENDHGKSGNAMADPGT